MGRSLLVTGHGLHAKHGAPYPALASEWLRPLVAAAGGRRVDVVYHTVDAPGSRKPDQYVMTQGDARIALVNRGQREQLHGWANTSTFPANITLLVADWFNLTHHANGCRHLGSFDGTHYGHVVNTEKARQLVRAHSNHKGRMAFIQQIRDLVAGEDIEDDFGPARARPGPWGRENASR